MAGRETVVARAAVVVLLAGALLCVMISCTKGPTALQGTVLERNSDPRKQSPVAGVEITSSIGSTSSVGQTDSSGYFNLKMRGWVRSGQPVHLEFRHPGYQPLSLDTTVSDKLYVVSMAPVPEKAHPEAKQPAIGIANVKIRYSMKSTAAVNVGSAVKAFEVVNTGNVPCKDQSPCSPDGRWKATIGSATLDAGEGNVFRSVRLSCIAGPCPFTKVKSDKYSEGESTVTATVLNWSDTTTFLLEAEVYRPVVNEVIQDSYPVIFGHTLNFSVPDTGEGVSIEADVDGKPVVFPLGPSLCLSWAECTVTTNKDHSKSYRCELQDGFRFQ